MPITLKQLLDQHPDWADLPMAVPSADSDGDFDFIGAAGQVIVSEDGDGKFLLFLPN